MKSLRFALCGITLLCLLFSCSMNGTANEKMPGTDNEAEYESVTDKDEDSSVDEKQDGDVSDLEEPDNDTSSDVSEMEEHDNDTSEEEENNPVDEEPDNPPVDNDPNVQVLQINELRTEYSAAQLRAEFIEFKANAKVNLGGMRVFIASNTKNPQVYEFLPVEVKEGEYFVLHLRTLEETCKDEYGNDLDESGGRDASPTARDFWVPGNTKLLRKTDIVYILDKDDNVIDAVMIAENPDSEWPNDYFRETAEFLLNQGAWKSADDTIPSPADAVDSSGIKTALTRSISRDETVPSTRTSADWYVTETGEATPGSPNVPRNQ